MSAPVVIVGAGPVGMTAALALHRQAVGSVVLESQPEHGGEGSKAICVQRDVLDLLDRLGPGAIIAGEGVQWTLARTYYRTKELFHQRMPVSGSEVFPPWVNISQSRVEELLLDELARCPDVEIRWSHRVTALEQDDEGATVTVDCPRGVQQIRASWVIGCDGAGSTVRKLAGIQFPGHSHEDRFLIADIRCELPGFSGEEHERRFFFDPPWNPGRQVLIHPQPDSVWRIDWQVPADTDLEEEQRSGRLDQRIRAIVGDTPYDVVWLTSYRFHQRCSERFRQGRVLLCGDAAHLMAPFGARGMNSGMQDVENLAWKLALVLQGHAPAELIGTYHAERWAAAQENLEVTNATMRFMAPPTRLLWAWRNLVLQVSSWLPPVRRFVNSGNLATPFDYRESAIIEPSDERNEGRPHPGQLAPDASCHAIGVRTPLRRLRDLVGPGFAVLVMPLGVSLEGFLEGFETHPPKVPVRVLAVANGDQPACDLDRAVTIVDTEGILRATYGAGRPCWYLIRPDGHIAARRDGLDGSAVAPAVEHAIGLKLPAGAPDC